MVFVIEALQRMRAMTTSRAKVRETLTNHIDSMADHFLCLYIHPESTSTRQWWVTVDKCYSKMLHAHGHIKGKPIKADKLYKMLDFYDYPLKITWLVNNAAYLARTKGNSPMQFSRELLESMMKEVLKTTCNNLAAFKSVDVYQQELKDLLIKYWKKSETHVLSR